MGSYDDAVSDEALLFGATMGDERASLVFVRRYQRRLYGLALSILGDASEADDVAQEAFLRIFRHAQVFDARRGSVSSWALTITRNLAIDAIRLRRGVPTDPMDQVFLEITSSAYDPDFATELRSEFSRTKAALSVLPIDQRRAVVLSAMYGWTAQEIAANEAVPIGTAKSRIRLGMAKLRKSVIDEESR
jgi:RNA polymerase sigma-70 factor (ECF subfamily)